MALNNPPFWITAASNALLASTVTQALGITLVSQMYYGQASAGAKIFVPTTNNLPALTLETVYPVGGGRTGFNAGSGSTTYRGKIRVVYYLAVTDYGTLETNAANLIDDLIGQGGTNLNILDVEIEDVTLPNQEIQAGADAGQPGMPTSAWATIEALLTWDG